MSSLTLLLLLLLLLLSWIIIMITNLLRSLSLVSTCVPSCRHHCRRIFVNAIRKNVARCVRVRRLTVVPLLKPSVDFEPTLDFLWTHELVQPRFPAGAWTELPLSVILVGWHGAVGGSNWGVKEEEKREENEREKNIVLTRWEEALWLLSWRISKMRSQVCCWRDRVKLLKSGQAFHPSSNRCTLSRLPGIRDVHEGRRSRVRIPAFFFFRKIWLQRWDRFHGLCFLSDILATFGTVNTVFAFGPEKEILYIYIYIWIYFTVHVLHRVDSPSVHHNFSSGCIFVQEGIFET